MPKNNEVNANNEVKFKIIEVKEITAKNGNKFTAYKTVGKGGKKLDVRFTKACKNVPTSTCTIVVKKEIPLSFISSADQAYPPTSEMFICRVFLAHSQFVVLQI